MADEAGGGGGPRAAALLAFWFGAPGSAECDRPREIWFKSTPAFDGDCRAGFAADLARALAGEFDAWQGTPDGALALVLLLDQMPRNIHRGTGLAFACDAKARATARAALARGFDMALPAVRRAFLYLPFEHSEELADQELAVRLYELLPPGPERDDQVDYARRHRAIVARFGRFPHRNRALGRVSTPDEEAFLKEPGSSF